MKAVWEHWLWSGLESIVSGKEARWDEGPYIGSFDIRGILVIDTEM
jgi:hypothetical protein